MVYASLGWWRGHLETDERPYEVGDGVGSKRKENSADEELGEIGRHSSDENGDLDEPAPDACEGD